MSRTYRRRSQRHEYRWVLREFEWVDGRLVPTHLEARSREGRKAIARFHSDSHATMAGSPPRWYRRIFDHRMRTLNANELRRWLGDPGYDPVFHGRHRHSAAWSWW